MLKQEGPNFEGGDLSRRRTPLHETSAVEGTQDDLALLRKPKER